MTLKAWLVMTQHNGVIGPFLKGHGDSGYLCVCVFAQLPQSASRFRPANKLLGFVLSTRPRH